MTTVLESFAAIFAPWVLSFVVDAVVTSAICWNVKTTSSAVTGLPSDHLRPGFSFQVTVLKSADTPPFATVGMSAARPFATGFAAGPHEASGSMTRRDASLSLVPVAWCGFRMVGACQYRIFSSPPSPRLNAAAGPLEPAAEPATVGVGLVAVVPPPHAAAR